jgi:hypothetical protein
VVDTDEGAEFICEGCATPGDERMASDEPRCDCCGKHTALDLLCSGDGGESWCCPACIPDTKLAGIEAEIDRLKAEEVSEPRLCGEHTSRASNRCLLKAGHDGPHDDDPDDPLPRTAMFEPSWLGRSAADDPRCTCPCINCSNKAHWMCHGEGCATPGYEHEAEVCRAHRLTGCDVCDEDNDDLWVHPRDLEAEQAEQAAKLDDMEAEMDRQVDKSGITIWQPPKDTTPEDTLAQLCQLTYLVEDVRNLLAALIGEPRPAAVSDIPPSHAAGHSAFLAAVQELRSHKPQQ